MEVPIEVIHIKQVCRDMLRYAEMTGVPMSLHTLHTLCSNKRTINFFLTLVGSLLFIRCAGGNW